MNQDESPFHIAQGSHLYERMPSVSKFNVFFNQAMASDARLVSALLVTTTEFKGLLEGVGTLVDVGGGDGTLAKAIAEAYPMMNCVVFDLLHVVDGLQGNGRNLTYVAGDMFEVIPRAHAIILKWIMHNWSDDNCIKVLKRCKESIPSKDEGGKLLIIEMVVGISSDNVNHSQSQFLMDMQMVSVLGAKERTEQQWKHLFINSGFGDYKILPILGSRSVIEVYPA
ncbi:hypothetical protein SOVF_028820 [Spinacia oleracea]|nr:hypothetical protein SOVF_028820 [Spinacia oleracea]